MSKSQPYWPHSDPEGPSTTQGSGLCICDHDQPRLALSGLVICGWHRTQARVGIEQIADLYYALEEQLTSAGGGTQERVNSTPQPGLSLNPKVVEVRQEIINHLQTWARVGLESGTWATWPTDSPRSIAAWIVTRIDWYSSHEWSDCFVEETLQIHSKARAHSQPNGVRRFDMKRACPEPDCKGTLYAELRPAGFEMNGTKVELPSVVWCDVAPIDPETGQQTHGPWPANEWIALGRHIEAKEQGA